ncbi:MAG: DNA polymerase IV [Clostridia bacterium]|nr:DNA polymerase IV [Clostridia bacterium]
MKGPTILHCDCNSFFASVETVLNPAYKNVPMAVCGSAEDRRGIVLAKNELAKKFGVQTAETIYSAKKKCPALVIADPHYDRYVEYSRRVNQIYARYTDIIEPFGIDESWLDVTASFKLFGSGEEIAERIRREVKEELGITVSIGVSFNKTFAKLGSDYKKPDAVTVINEENFRSIVYPLPVSDLLFVGKKTAERLLQMNVRTVGDLANVSLPLLEHSFGKHGTLLHRCATGEEDSPVTVPTDEVKSIGRGCTFRRDLLTREECYIGLLHLCEQIGEQLRAKGLVGSTVSLKIKDEYLVSIQRQKALTAPTDLSKEILALAYEILCEQWKSGKPIRMLTVTVTGLMKKSEVSEQISLFDDPKTRMNEKEEKIEKTKDSIRQKFGSSAIFAGSVMDEDLGLYRKHK